MHSLQSQVFWVRAVPVGMTMRKNVLFRKSVQVLRNRYPTIIYNYKRVANYPVGVFWWNADVSVVVHEVGG